MHRGGPRYVRLGVAHRRGFSPTRTPLPLSARPWRVKERNCAWACGGAMASPFRGTGAPGYALGGTPSSPMLEQDSRFYISPPRHREWLCADQMTGTTRRPSIGIGNDPALLHRKSLHRAGTAASGCDEMRLSLTLLVAATARRATLGSKPRSMTSYTVPLVFPSIFDPQLRLRLPGSCRSAAWPVPPHPGGAPPRS